MVHLDHAEGQCVEFGIGHTDQLRGHVRRVEGTKLGRYRADLPARRASSDARFGGRNPVVHARWCAVMGSSVGALPHTAAEHRTANANLHRSKTSSTDSLNKILHRDTFVPNER